MGAMSMQLRQQPAHLQLLVLSIQILTGPDCALQLAMVVLMVTGIHFIEAYLLNPAIYSAHLKLHPLLVLTVLVVAEHSLGVWGLLLAGISHCLKTVLCMQGDVCSLVCTCGSCLVYEA